MANIEIHLYFITAVIVLSFLHPFLLWFLNIVGKNKLAKINTFEEFKKKMKIMAIKKWIKPGVTLTNEEIRKEVIKEIEKKEKLFKKLQGWPLQIPIYTLYVIVLLQLSRMILRYYITVKTGYNFPLKFPVVEVLLLICMFLWMSAFLFTKLGYSRINMFLKKLNELKD